MLALIAAVCFALAAFGAHIDHVNLVYLGLAFFAADFAYPIRSAWMRRR
jgi:hypothetical protein